MRDYAMGEAAAATADGEASVLDNTRSAAAVGGMGGHVDVVR